MRKMDSKSSSSEGAGFDYYLEALEQKKEEAGLAIQLDLLRLLAKAGGKMKLYDLISTYLHGEVTGDDWLDLTGRIKRMQDLGLVSIVSVSAEDTSSKDLSVKITELGEKTLEAQGPSALR